MIRKKINIRISPVIVLVGLILGTLTNVLFSQVSSAAVQALVFPVLGKSSYSNDYNAPRSINGTHQATDIIAGKRQKIVSASNGTIQYVIDDGEQGWETAGHSIRIRGTDGYTYNYYHINNDTPGTDDGNGGMMNAFAPDVEPGSRVIKGQLIGYVGDSGNAEGTVSHLHFEIHHGSARINPYEHLNRANRISAPKNYPTRSDEILPFGPGSFRGGARVAAGDIDGDGTDEIIAAAGPGGQSIKMFEKNGTQIGTIIPFGSSFKGGADVATGDIDGDGTDEIIAAAGPGGQSIKMFEKNGTQTGAFVPFGSSFKGGADVATGDIDGDGTDEIITAAGRGGRSVKMFEANGTQTGMFVPFSETFRGGASVATGDLTGDTKKEIIAAAKKGGGPRIVTTDGNGTELSTFYAYTTTFNGGVRVEAGEVDSRFAKDEIITISETKGSTKVRYRKANGQMIKDASPVAEDWWRGYYDLTDSADGDVTVALNVNRRTSLRISD